jgi:hypothetical protein
MKQINNIMFIKNVGSDTPWEEPMTENVQDDVTAEQRANQIVNNFNRTLRPGELERELVKVEDTDKKSQVSSQNVRHIWKKKSLVTERGGFDKYECEACGATGKRHGLSESVVIDKRFIKRQYNCPGKKK